MVLLLFVKISRDGGEDGCWGFNMVQSKLVVGGGVSGIDCDGGPMMH